jgi:arylsulfatase A-like enzyme
VGGKLIVKKEKKEDKFFDNNRLAELRQRQIDAVKHLDRVVEELFDTVPKNTYTTITADHGELFGEDGYFGHGPIYHEKVWEVPFVEAQLRWEGWAPAPGSHFWVRSSACWPGSS